MKKILFLLIAVLALAFGGCSEESADEISSEVTESAQETVSDIVFAKRGEDCNFWLTYNVDVEADERDDILQIRYALDEKLDVKIRPLDDYDPDNEKPCEIIVNSARRPECLELMNTLSENEYAIKTIVSETKTSIIIAYKGGYARMCAIENFIENYVGEDEAKVPANLDVTEKVKPLLIGKTRNQTNHELILIHSQT
jgi:hypothetical protein